MIGELNGDLLEAVLETVPIEFSVLDESDKVVLCNRNS
jgi:hypothetical protein